MALPPVVEGDPHPKAHNDERAVINTLLTAVSEIPAGAPGKSAYQIWLDAGNVGTQAQFLASLKGDPGTSLSITKLAPGANPPANPPDNILYMRLVT